MKKCKYLLFSFLIMISCGSEHFVESSYRYLSKNNVLSDDPSAIIFLSPNCSGVKKFMPVISSLVTNSTFDDFNIKLVVVSPRSEDFDSQLNNFLSTYSIPRNSVYLIDPELYGKLSFTNGKLRYENFINDLCGECNDGSLGYPQFFIFKNREFKYKGYLISSDKVIDFLRMLK